MRALLVDYRILMVVLLSDFSIAFVGRCKVYGMTIIDLMVITTIGELNNSI